MAFALTVATTHTKTLVSPDSGSEDKVYGSDYVSASSHTSAVSVAGATSGGVLYADSTTTLASSALLAANALVIGGGAGAAPFTDGTNLLYTTASGPRLQVGSGSGASSGFILGYEGTNSGYSALWWSGLTPTASNYALRVSDGATIIGAGGSGPTVVIAPNNVNKTVWVLTAGAGPAITAGTATTDVNAMSVTQTWNAAGVTFTAEKLNVTATAKAAGSLLRDYQVATVSQWKLGFGGNTVQTGTITTPGGATFHTTSTALTDGAGVGGGTLLTAPAAGNPTKWIGIDDNGTVRYIPAW